jgi:hypothetical protein
MSILIKKDGAQKHALKPVQRKKFFRVLVAHSLTLIAWSTALLGTNSLDVLMVLV